MAALKSLQSNNYLIPVYDNLNINVQPTLSSPTPSQSSTLNAINEIQRNTQPTYSYSDGSRDYYYQGYTYKITSGGQLLVSNGLYFTPADGLSGRVIASDQLTGNALGGLINTKGLTPGWTPEGYAWFDLNSRLGIAINAFMGDSGSWVFNPYKSKHYDNLCIAATGFNKRKEQQLLCKRLVCIEKMQKSGGPLEACEFDYNLGMCMYVDSARYKIEGSAGPLKIFGAIGRTFFSNILGNSAFYLYWTTCVLTLKKTDQLFDPLTKSCTSPTGPKRVICGVMGSVISLNEIIKFAEGDYNPTKSTTPLDPVKQAGGQDFCQGIDLT
jgi:hypothetical protein